LEPTGPEWRRKTGIEKWAQQAASIAKNFAEALRPLTELGDQLSRTLGPMSEALPQWTEWVKRRQERVREAFPPNWRDFDIDKVVEAVDFMVKNGLNLASVPRATKRLMVFGWFARQLATRAGRGGPGKRAGAAAAASPAAHR
jgi:hypothetical protein